MARRPRQPTTRKKLVYKREEWEAPLTREEWEALPEWKRGGSPSEWEDMWAKREALVREGRKIIDCGLAIRDGLVQDQPQLPTTPPEHIRRKHKVWLAAQQVFALTREGIQWIDLDDLLSKIRARIGGDSALSMRTLNSALTYLREGGFIGR